MPRPIRERFVGNVPNINYFKPAGVPLVDLEEVVISIEELEAIRLKDFLELDQTTSAKKMNISQPTFHRLLLSARKKLSDAIVNGKAIRIDGGNYKVLSPRRFFGGGRGLGRGLGRGFGNGGRGRMRGGNDRNF